MSHLETTPVCGEGGELASHLGGEALSLACLRAPLCAAGRQICLFPDTDRAAGQPALLPPPPRLVSGPFRDGEALLFRSPEAGIYFLLYWVCHFLPFPFL